VVKAKGKSLPEDNMNKKAIFALEDGSVHQGYQG
jgi:hypothetical protein